MPGVFKPAPGGSGYYNRGYRYEQAGHYRYWQFVAIRAIIDEVAGGDPPNFGTVTFVSEQEQRQGRSIKKRLGRNGQVRKALGGPKDEEEFEAYPHDHPIQKVFRNPNGPDVAFDLWAYHTLFLKLMGVSHWWVMRNAYGVPVEIWVIPPHWAQLVVDREGMPEGYIVQSPWGHTTFVPYEDVVSFYEHSPLGRYEGWAASQAVAEWIDTYEAKTRMQLAVFKNGAVPAFHVALGEAYADPDEQFLARFYAKWFARFQGEDNSGRPLITGADVQVKAIDGHRPADALVASLQAEDQIRDMMLAAYKVPKGVVGLEPVSDTSAYAPQRAFCRFAINPMLKYMGEVIQEKIVKATPGCEDGVCFWEDRVANDVEMDERQLQSDLSTGVRSPNEARQVRGLQPWPNGGNNPNVNGEEMPWMEEVKQQPEQPLEQAFQRSLREARGIEDRSDRDDDPPLVVGTTTRTVTQSLNGNVGAAGAYLLRRQMLPSHNGNGNGRH